MHLVNFKDVSLYKWKKRDEKLLPINIPYRFLLQFSKSSIKSRKIAVNATAFFDLGFVNLFSVTFLKQGPVPIKNDFS